MLGVPDGLLIRPTLFAIFDNVNDELTLASPVYPCEAVSADAAWQAAQARLDEADAALDRPLPHPAPPVALPETPAPASNFTKEEFLAQAKDMKQIIVPELVLIEVLRAHLAMAPTADRGWLAALRDPVLAPALALLHRSPEHPWTVAELASGAAVSRSLLDARFRQLLDRSPIRYLTEWRMHLAEDLLATTDLTIFDIARRVGYVSEEAFSRAFKRERGSPPSHWRGRP